MRRRRVALQSRDPGPIIRQRVGPGKIEGQARLLHLTAAWKSRVKRASTMQPRHIFRVWQAHAGVDNVSFSPLTHRGL